VKRILAAHPEYKERFTPLPFNSGYFMCIRPKADPEKLRQKLLSDYSTGVINFGEILRVAFSATPLLGHAHRQAGQAVREHLPGRGGAAG
jgi:hypothetical protein